MVIFIKKFLKVFVPLIICIVVSSIFVFVGLNNFKSLNKPMFSPPSFVFSIVWSIIYLIFYFTMKNNNDSKTYILYIITLILHVIWNLTFFTLHFYIIALIVLLIIYIEGFVFVYNISKTNKKIFYIYLIYIIWLLIALYLNFGIVLLN